MFENPMRPHATIQISIDQLSMMANLVKKALERALQSLFESNTILAREVVEADKAINSYEIDIDNSTFSLLVVSRIPPDILRSVLSIQKINSILERIGDHAVNIAESAMSLALWNSNHGSQPAFFALPEMAGICMKILNDTLLSFFKQDVEKAQEVLLSDEKVDLLNISISNEVKNKVMAKEISFEVALDIIRICKNLERIGDLSTNIAEETNFSAAGRIVKHHEDKGNEPLPEDEFEFIGES